MALSLSLFLFSFSYSSPNSQFSFLQKFIRKLEFFFPANETRFSYPWKKLQPSNQDPPPKMKGSSRFFTFRLVSSWYCSNIGVRLLNKYLLSNYGFKYLIFLTMCHMAASSLLNNFVIA